MGICTGYISGFEVPKDLPKIFFQLAGNMKLVDPPKKPFLKDT